MENIAIIGIANLFPGAAAPDEFWQNLLDKKDCRSKATAHEMGIQPEAYFGKKGDTDKYYCMSGGYIGDANFDANGYLLEADYLRQLDDLHQWALYVAKAALADAGYLNQAALEKCGVILGNLSFPTKSSNQLFLPIYHHAVEKALQESLHQDFRLSHYTDYHDVHADNGLIAGYPAALIAQALGLGGSHFALDAACASSCYSAQLACQYLQTGEADLMLAGAVSAADPMFVNMGFSIFQAYPGNQFSAPLDGQSQGLYAGEGAGMMLLKRHSDAVRDGDTIHAIIQGGALSNDGKGEFVLSPNSKGQVLAYERAYENAGINPADVAYVECHATGTPKGDRVELNSMETFFSRHENKPLIGSVKSNLGHLLTAAGMPGMTKAIYAVNKGQIPATINLQQPLSSKNGFFNGQSMPTELTPWPRKQAVNTAAVSVFGFGGSNAHIVLQAANAPLVNNPQAAKPAQPLAIIGMDAHFAHCDSLASFKSLLAQKHSAIRPLPENRWKGLEKDPQLMQALAIKETPQGGFIEQFDIDFLRFKVPPNEKDQLIPQQLLMMKVADNAALDAGLKEGSNVAVLVAMGIELELHQYRGRVNLSTQIAESLSQQGIQLSAEQQEQLENIAKDSVATAAQLNQYTSFIGNIMASRISALWDFSGPAITVSAEENSVFRCVELAQNLFRTSDVEAVIIAAVDLAGSIENISLRQHYAPMQQAGQAGWQAGEGAGAFVLVPEDRITAEKTYASIDSLAFAKGNNAEALELAANRALAQKNLSSDAITAIECYASGIAAEDAAEQQAMQTVYAGKPQASIKQQIGHCFAASGMASIIRAALVANDSGQVRIGINSLGRDNSAAHLILGANAPTRPMPQIATPAKQLIKVIRLGGKPIEQTLKQQLQAAGIQIAAPKTTQIARPLRLDNIQAIQPIAQAAVAPTIIKPTITTAGQTMTSPKNVYTPPSTNGTDLFSQQTKTHAAFLELRHAAQQKIAAMITGQAPSPLAISQATRPVATAPVASQQAAPQAVAPVAAAVQTAIEPTFCHNVPATQTVPSTSSCIQLVERFNKPKNIVFDTADLVEFAEGDIANVFGPEFSIIDTYKRRVRLPTTDYLLVTRVTDLDATPNVFEPCYMATEYDIPVDAPFLIDGQIPWSVNVESGQCDLMLISYLGIDFMCKGERVYRLLDCQLTFKEDMAFGGETLRYEIYIDSFARNGDQFLFFFHYDCLVDGKVVLEMRNGCAGFFTDEELDDGKGVIFNDKDRAEIANAKKGYFPPLIQNSRTQYGYDDMMMLVNGDVAGCFGPEYDQGGLNPSLKFSSQKFLMIEQVTQVDQQGGPWGLGVLYGQKRLEPDHWYFPCHFKDDEVMAGSLMSEGCGQLAMFYMLWLGMHKNVKNARFQPMPGESQTVRCRGQVTPQSGDLIYRMTVTAIGMHPQPFMKANVEIILNDKVVVDFKNLAVMIKEQDPNHPYAAKLPEQLLENKLLSSTSTNTGSPVAVSNVQQELDERGIAPFANVNAPLMWVESDHSVAKIKGVTPVKHKPAPMPSDAKKQNRVPDTTPFTPWHLFEFATGNISNCFGPEFDVYKGRIPPRTPCGDLQLTTQIVDIQGERLNFKSDANCVAEYEVPENAWYLAGNNHPAWIPYSMLMEISLQPNGFISGYMGTTLMFPDKDLFFRNLDGNGVLLRDVDLRGKTITNKSVLLNTSTAGGAIIQSFTFELSTDGQPFYEGKAVFGYFSEHALTHQLGIDNGRITQAWFVDNNTPESQKTVIDLRRGQHDFFQANTQKPHYRLAGGQMNFVDTVTIVENGGDYQKGYIYGERTVDASDWFFRYHFHQDPVMPGSLGLEAMIELLQTYALQNDLGAGFKNPRFSAPLTEVVWKYRGQITPENKQMSLDVHIKDVIKTTGEVRIIGDANLSKDGLRIYQVKDIVLSVVES